MFDTVGELNWLAVVLATVAYFALGALWFTPLFGRAWDSAIGVPRTKGQRFPPIYYVVPLVSSLAVTVATAVLLNALQVETFADAILLGLLVGIGYAAAISFNNALTPNTPRPVLLGAVTGSYHVAGIVIVATIVHAMP